MKGQIGQPFWRAERCPRCKGQMIWLNPDQWFCDECKEVVNVEVEDKNMGKRWCKHCESYQVFSQGRCSKCQQ